MVRLFAGGDFVADDVQRHDVAKHGYQESVPMGGDVPNASYTNSGVKIPEGAPAAVQDRAYTSPVWHTPGS